MNDVKVRDLRKAVRAELVKEAIDLNEGSIMGATEALGEAMWDLFQAHIDAGKGPAEALDIVMSETEGFPDAAHEEYGSQM